MGHRKTQKLDSGVVRKPVVVARKPRSCIRKPAGFAHKLAAKVTAAMSSSPEGAAEARFTSEAEGDFEVARARTLQALADLAQRWRDAGTSAASAIVEAIDAVVSDPEALSADGFTWSRDAGLSFVLPSGALQCRPLAMSLGADGLSISRAGGPVVPTHPGLIVAPAPPCGFGVFATVEIRKGTKLGEYLGIACSYDVWVKEITAAKVARRGSGARVPFIRDELYAAWTGEGPRGAGVVVDAFSAGNTMRFINCSCAPNATFESFGEGPEQHYRLQVVAKREIEAGEQLSVDYAWYHDGATLEDVRMEAIHAFNADVADLNRLREWLRSQRSTDDGGVAGARLPEPVPHSLTKSGSEAFCILAKAISDARGPVGLQVEPPSFLERFVDPEAVMDFLAGSGISLKEASDIHGIPDALWMLYEVVGSDRVGISCRCGLDPSLNSKGLCFGIIGRPPQAEYDGRNGDVSTFCF